MIHLGLLLLTITFMVFRYITNMEKFRLMAKSKQMDLGPVMIVAAIFLFLFVELAFWGVYLVYQFLTT